MGKFVLQKGHGKWKKVQCPIKIESLSSLHLLPKNCYNVLKKLKIINADIDIIPSKIFKLAQLEELNLRANQITQLSKKIQQLSRLKILNVSNNKIKSIPREIGKLAQLNELYVDQNYLTTLPSTIGKLSQLKSLYITYNNLEYLPQHVCDKILQDGFDTDIKTAYLLGVDGLCSRR